MADTVPSEHVLDPLVATLRAAFDQTLADQIRFLEETLRQEYDGKWEQERAKLNAEMQQQLEETNRELEQRYEAKIRQLEEDFKLKVGELPPRQVRNDSVDTTIPSFAVPRTPATPPATSPFAAPHLTATAAAKNGASRETYSYSHTSHTNGNQYTDGRSPMLMQSNGLQGYPQGNTVTVTTEEHEDPRKVTVRRVVHSVNQQGVPSVMHSVSQQGVPSAFGGAHMSFGAIPAVQQAQQVSNSYVRQQQSMFQSSLGTPQLSNLWPGPQIPQPQFVFYAEQKPTEPDVAAPPEESREPAESLVREGRDRQPGSNHHVPQFGYNQTVLPQEFAEYDDLPPTTLDMPPTAVAIDPTDQGFLVTQPVLR